MQESKYAAYYIDIYGDDEWEQIPYEDLGSYCKAASWLGLPIRHGKCAADPGITTVSDATKAQLRILPLSERDEQVLCDLLCTQAQCRANNLLVGFDDLKLRYDNSGEQSIAIDEVAITPFLAKSVGARKLIRWAVQSLDCEDNEEQFGVLDSAILAAAKRAYAKRLELSFQAIQDKEMGEYYAEQAALEA